MNQKSGIKVQFSCEVERKTDLVGKAAIFSTWDWEHWRDNKLIDSWQQGNICTDEGLTDLLDVAFSNGTKIATWYLLLFNDNYTPIAGNTYAVPGFTESTDYTEGTRPTWQEAGPSAKSITNSANKASFTMGGVDTTIYGSALVGGGSAANTKGNTAGGGKLFASSKFDTAKSGIENGDILKATCTLTAQDVV